jgi:hypothetical protein
MVGAGAVIMIAKALPLAIMGQPCKEPVTPIADHLV